MSMNQDTESFEPLRRLLKLKRYEQAPPGYFNDFSRQVIARIKLGEQGEQSAGIDRLVWEAPWLQRIWAAFEAKPILAGVCAFAMCGVLIAGVVFSEKTDVQPLALIPPTESAPDSVEVANLTTANHPLLAKPAALDASSTNPIATLETDGPLLGSLRAQPARFTFPGRN